MKTNRDMHGNLKFRMFLVLAFMLAAPWAEAQLPIPETDFAGPDTTILHAGPGRKKIVVGMKDKVYETPKNGIKPLYQWDLVNAPSGYVAPPMGAVVYEGTASLYRHWAEAWVSVPGDYTFQVLRTSKWGDQIDEVVVTVKERPEIVNVKAKVKCYVPEEPIRLDHFIIETDPPLPESEIVKYVSLAEDSQVANKEILGHIIFENTGWANNMEIHFMVKDANFNNPERSDYTLNVNLYDEITIVEIGVDVNKAKEKILGKNEGDKTLADRLEQFLKLVDRIKNANKNIKEIFENKLPRGNFIGTDPPVSVLAGASIEGAVLRKCCTNEAGLYGAFSVNGELGIQIDLKYRLPPPFTAAYIPVTGKVAGSLSVNHKFCMSPWSLTACDEWDKIQLTVGLALGAGLGIGTKEAGLYAQVVVEGGGEATWEFDVLNKPVADFKGADFWVVLRIEGGAGPFGFNHEFSIVKFSGLGD